MKRSLSLYIYIFHRVHMARFLSRDGVVKAEAVLGIILLLELPQTTQLVLAVNLLLLLVAPSVVDVRRQAAVSGGSGELVAQLDGKLVGRLAK